MYSRQLVGYFACQTHTDKALSYSLIVCSTILSPVPTARDSGAHELQFLLQPFGPVRPTEKVAPNLTKLQTLIN